MLIIAGIAGALIGSFLNVVVYRLPRGQSIISPASACPLCHQQIRSFDNVPILSWLYLHGKCRNCRAGISLRYPLVEIATATLFILILWRFPPTSIGTTLDLLALLYLASISVALGLIDLDTHTLPNRIVLPSYIVGAILMLASAISMGQAQPLIRAVIGAALMWLIYLFMALAYKGGMGFGDVKTAGALGLFLGYLGWKVLIVGAFAAFFLGGVFALALLITRRVSVKSGIPFGPWMLVGAWVGIFLGGGIAQNYLSLFGLSQSF
jgi:leader peptidase (prepilin peptidase)/N-methyltransferase